MSRGSSLVTSLQVQANFHSTTVVSVQRLRGSDIADSTTAIRGASTTVGSSRLPRKMHKGLRKTHSILAKSCSLLLDARARQNGCHHRAELNKKVYRIGSGDDE